jgi:hypothetical protein
MRRALWVLLAALAPTALAADLDVEVGLDWGAGPYFQLRYNYPLARFNLPGEPYVWLLPELGLYSRPGESYVRLQALLETERLTWAADARYSARGEWVCKFALRFSVR